MAANPLEPNPARDAKIRAKAEELWKADGAPHCGPQTYLEQASEIIGMEENPNAGEIPVKDLPDPEFADTQVEDARIQENLGEFPERLTDQGDRDHFPEKENERNAQ
ncbi:hypothetical protein [Kozakia baliensis]|uniref:Uncharacterized protein n=1 Tax=Kozakia baliensis TaxID=153496 RepID=A0A1D8USB1_9PROT|nr:hypothetical protein [Kozakia baliensis]AOX16387.1 hypothetical protein A0U89_03790 [Kozakia baliensis]GBR28818.1 hypothetical protein AA0488_1554 [Kozakia baliensis NRIC 0488]GEL63537.1 hypothetical protein KBA01_08230 [Kozakia baliensis]